MNASLFSQTALRDAALFQGGAKPLDSECYHSAMTNGISRYAFQGEKHTRMCERDLRIRRMGMTVEQRRELLRQFINTRGLKIARWVKASGVDKNSIYNFLNGHSGALDLRTYAKLARTAEVPMWKLTGDTPDPPSPTSLWVIGDVQAGLFVDAVEWDQSRWEPVDVPIEDRFRGKAKALRVRGGSMNVEYPDGSIVVFVKVLDFREPRDGDHLIVYAYRHDGTIEATVKELRIQDGRCWLWPRSTLPEFQAPIDCENPGDEYERIEQHGIVVGGYKQREV